MPARRGFDRQCSFPGCGLPDRTHGLCEAHYSQERAGGPLRPIQYRGARPPRPEVLVRVRALLVPAWCADVVQADLPGARQALEDWVRSRPGGQCQRADWCCKPNRHRGACLRRVGQERR